MNLPLSDSNSRESQPETPSPSIFALDEIANTITHGLGFLLSLYALTYFWSTSADNAFGLRLYCVVFAVSMATVYLCSTLSHCVLEQPLRDHMRAWDQGTIYLLIAGTHSPFIWQSSPPGWTVPIMLLVWSAALWGFYAKVIAQYKVNASSTVTYVLLGWLPALPLIARTPQICFLWMFLGGVSYTLGIVFLIRSHHAWFTHSLWHIMVILGSFCHCIAINELLAYARA